MRYALEHPVCPLCGSFRSGGMVLGGRLQARCPACQAHTPSYARGPGLLSRLRRVFRQDGSGIQPPKMPIWG